MKNSYQKKWRWPLMLISVLAIACGCKGDDSEVKQTATHDPDKPVVITWFTPDNGSAYSQLLIAGDNFGSDTEQISVRVGGVEAVVISANGTNIYCYVPAKAYSGTIEVLVGEKPEAGETDTRKTATAEKVFAYQSEMVMSTIAGYRNQNDDQGWLEGPFTAGADGRRYAGFRNDCIMNFDPQNRDHLYIGYDGYAYIQMIDLEKKEIRNAFSTSKFPVGGSQRIRSIDFSLELPKYNKPAGHYMIVTFDVDFSGFTTPSVFLVERNAGGTFDDTCSVTTIGSYRQCNGAAVHPNGEIYFNSYEKGQVFRFDLNDYLENPTAWNPNALENPKIEMLFTIADPNWEFKIFIHPTGNYAYLVVINNHYIMRTDYNPTLKRFATPYVVAGHYKVAGYQQDVATNAYLNRPYQGVFVKNPEYTTGDQYDFYFTEHQNHCVSKLTPSGVVSTFAGRGSNSALSDGNVWGADDGALRTMARFRDPSGMAYDEATETFYVISTVGRTLRTISMDKGE